MSFTPQAGLVREIAGEIADYRNGGASLVKFTMECGVALNRWPILSRITIKPKMKDERFQIGDDIYKRKYGSDRDAFFAAVDAFMECQQFLAWNGRSSVARGAAPVKALSEDYAHPTMQIKMMLRRRGQAKEQQYAMLFVGFADDAAAKTYADKHAHLIF